MPTITDAQDQHFTILIEFEVEPEQQQALIAGLADQVEAHFTRFTGFISASFHANDDGRRVINYAQWRSRKAWKEALAGNNEVDATIHNVIVGCGAKPLTVDTFCVTRVVENTRI